MHIYIIRHAKTGMNTDKRILCGKTDVGISDEGRTGILKIAGAPVWKTVEHVYTGTLARSEQTARLLFGWNIGKTADPVFNEVDFGDCECASLVEMGAENPIVREWEDDPESLVFPNGESLVEKAVSVYDAVMRIAMNEPYKSVAIVSSATTIRLLIAAIIDGNIKRFREVPCPNGQAFHLICDGCRTSVRAMAF